MSANLKVRRNVVTSVAVFTVNLALVFLSYRLLAQQGGVAIIGLWSSLMAWVFLIRLGDVGMTNGIIRFAAACDPKVEFERIRGYVDTGLMLNAILFALLACVGWAIMDASLSQILPGGDRNSASVRPLLPLLFAVFYLQNLSGLVMGALQAIHRGYIASLILLSGTLTQLVLALLLIPSMGLAGLALAQTGQYTLMLVVGWRFYCNSLARTCGQPVPLLPRRASCSTAREVMGFSLKAQLANFVNGLFEPLAKLLIGHGAGLHILGLFEIAYKIVVLPRNALVAGVMAAVPAKTRLFASNKTAFQELHRKSTRTVGLAATLLLGVVVLVSPLAMPLWLGHDEPLLPKFVALLALGFWVNAISASSYALGIASGTMRTNIEASFVAIGVLLLLMVPARQSEMVLPMVLSVAIAIATSSVWVLWRAKCLQQSTGATETVAG